MYRNICDAEIKQGSRGLWKWETLFKALKVCENGVGSVKVCEFYGLWSAGEKTISLSVRNHNSQDRTLV